MPERIMPATPISDEQPHRSLALSALAEPPGAGRAGDALYPALIDLVPAVVWTARADGWVDHANQFWVRFTGLAPEQTYGWGWTAALHPDDVTRVADVWAQAIRAGEQVDVEYRVRRAPDGVYRWFLARGVPVRDPAGRVVKWFGTLTDIDEQKRLEEEHALLLAREQKARADLEAALHARDETLQALAVKEEQYRVLAEVMPQCIWTAGPDGQTDYVNQHWCHYSGLTAEESLGAGWSAVLHPEDAPGCFAAWTRAVRTGEVFEAEYRMRRMDGVYRWFLGRGLPVRDPDGRVIKWLGTATDIDDRKRAEEEVQRRHGLARLLYQVTVAAYGAATVEQAMQVALDGVCAFAGWPVGHAYLVAGTDPPQLVPSPVWHLDRPDDFARFHEATAATRLVPGEGLPGRVFARREPVWIVDVARDGNFPRAEAAAALGLKGACGFPILAAGGVVAVLEFFTSTPREPDELLMQAMFQIGIQLGHVFDRGRAVADLEQAKKAAETANRAKSEFLSRMSHELRTPLNAILGFGQLLEMGSPTPRQRQQVEQILKGGRYLLELINEVLDLSRIEAGRMHLSLEPVSVRQACAEVCDLVRPLAERHGIRVEAPCATGADVHVLADNQRLKQVLLNLVANGVKYNHAHGSVSLSWEERPDGRVRLAVRDTGPGIPPEKRERLFSPFDRLGAETTAVEGTGLGLVLSKRLTEAMGGTLNLVSAAGEGTTILVDLPRAAAPSRSAVRRAAVAPAQALASPGNRTVLYIEDNRANLGLMEDVLAYRPEVQLLSAMQGSAGLELARTYRPDLILLDVHLPDMSGDEVLRQLRVDPRLRAIPVVVISADATPHQVEQLRAAGARDYLTKPIDVSRFLGLLDRLLYEGQVNP
jgi:PAS domain S-box-containing protein